MSSAPGWTAWLDVAATLAQEFRLTAAARDRSGGTPSQEIERLRAAGLLTLLIPAPYGGSGETWELACRVVREIARADGSLAHLLGYHYHFAELARFHGTVDQQAWNFTQAAEAGWFWGGSVNPRDPDVLLRRDHGRLLLRGRKTFCTGARAADRLIVAARREETDTSLFLSIPAQRPGIVVNDDWDNMGQRQAESGSVEFHDVEVWPEEFIERGADEAARSQGLAAIGTPIVQLVFVNLYVGIALGAFDVAREYTHTTMRPWLTSGVDAARHDPYVIEQYGTLWADLSAAVALSDQAGAVVQRAYERGAALTADERAEVAIAVASAKIVATRVSLSVTSAIFEVMGARATAAGLALDRFWRNVRTHTLHDPVAYKVREVGNYVLNGIPPEPTAYS